MKKFLINTAVFLVPFLSVVLIIYQYPQGSIDNFYLRFTSPKQTSLILGSSRSAHGIVPEEINNRLEGVDIFNYSFSINQSPYGSVYFESIKKKLREDAAGTQIFILAVDPWSISSESKNPNDSTSFRELKGSLAKVNDVNSNPNYEYLIKCLDERNIKLLLNSPITKLHKDGWLEVNANMEENYLQKNIDKKIGIYVNRLSRYRFSEVRLLALKRIIRFLKERGNVYLVRLPVHDKMEKLEGQLIDDFDGLMSELSTLESVPYFNLMPLSYRFQYTDGNHLYKDSSREVSRILADLIKEELRK